MIKGRSAWVLFVLSVALFITSAWPGWMTNDSLDMWYRATTDTINDWRSPLLIWFWKYLGAHSLGPVIPFLFQASAFWGGLFLIVARLQRLGWQSSWLLFPGVFLLDATWTVAWIMMDPLATALVVLAIGLVASSDLHPTSRWLWPSISLVTVGIIAPRWYLAPLGLIALGLLLNLAYPIPRRTIAISLVVFLGSGISFYIFEEEFIDPEPSYVAGSTLMLDIARVECNVGSPRERSVGRSLFPEELVRQVPGDDICQRFDTYYHDPLFGYRVNRPSESDYVLPDSKASMERLTNAWLEVVSTYPGIVGEARVKQFFAFLDSGTGIWWSPSKQLSSNQPLHTAGSMGDGETYGWASASRTPLVFSAAFASLGRLVLLDFGDSRFGLLALILVPAGTALLGWNRGRNWRLRYVPALAFPLLFSATMALLAPAADVRYIMPAVAWSLATAVLAVVDRRQVSPQSIDESTTRSSNRA